MLRQQASHPVTMYLRRVDLHLYSTYRDAMCRGADKSLARPGSKKATATEDFDFHISYLQS